MRIIIIKRATFALALLAAACAIADPVASRPAEAAASGKQESPMWNDPYVSLSAGQYAELEAQYAPLLKAYLAGEIPEEDVSEKLNVFGKADLEQRFDAWVKAYPKSYTARLARGIARMSQAWRLRGDKFANETTDNQFKSFLEGLSQAEADLNASIPLYPKPIWSYSALIRVSMGRDTDLAKGRALLDKALKLDPRAVDPRADYQMLLTPKWGGSVALMEEFLKECNNAPLTQKNKEKLQLRHHVQLGWHAKQEKEYKRASDNFLKAYELEHEPHWLFESGQAAMDGNFNELSFQRFDALVKAHPKYAYGYTKRGWLYEAYLKDDAKAFSDYVIAADLGNSWAQNRVGWWLLTGKGVKQDYDRAELYLRRAADQKNDTAVANLKHLEKLRKARDSAK